MDKEPLLHVVLHQPEIPQNTGNIGRTCVALGAKLWMVRPLGFRLDEKDRRRAGLDYWQKLTYEVVDDWPQLLERLASHCFWYFSKHATRYHWDARFERGDVLVFGSETRGLPPSVRGSNPDHSLRLPMRPDVRSLNLSAAVAVGAYEAMRQIAQRENGVPLL